MRDPFDTEFKTGLRLFNQGRFYECHDTIEEIWLQESSDQQPFLQGLIQAAVAFHHFEQDRWGAARSMLRLALEKLDGYPDNYRGVRVAPLRSELTAWKADLDRAIAENVKDGWSRGFPMIEVSEG